MRIAASNSTDYDKGQAELVCNGSNDRTILQQAMGIENEKVVISAGIYNADRGANGIDGNPYLYPARGVSVIGENNPVLLASSGICRIMTKKPNVVLQGFTGQGYIHIQNYESNQTFKDLKLSNTLPGQRWLDWRKKGGCTGHIQNWLPKGQTMSGLIFDNVTLEDSYHHGIGFHINNAQEGATWKDITISGCNLVSPGSGLETTDGPGAVPGDRDWSTGVDVDTGDILNMTVRNTTVTDSWQSGFHTDGNWTGHSQTIKNLVFEKCTVIGAGRRAGTTPKEMYEAGFYLQDALMKDCRTENCRVGYLIGTVTTGGLVMKNCADTGSLYSLVVEYGGNGAQVDNFVSRGAKRRALQVLGKGVNYTNITIEDFKGSGQPIMLGKMEKVIYIDAPSHQEDVKRYLQMKYSVSGRFDIVSKYTKREDLATVWTGSSMNWDGFTMSYLKDTTGPVGEPNDETGDIPNPIPLTWPEKVTMRIEGLGDKVYIPE